VLTSSVTINGVTKTVGGNYFGYDLGENDGGLGTYSRQLHQSLNTGGGVTQNLSNDISNNTGTLPSSITTPFVYAVSFGDTASGYFSFSGPTSETIHANLATLAISNHIRAVESAVPEPSTWAMMLLGFAGVGFIGYRRSRKSTMALSAA
jgi:hypothetical protein